MVAQNLHRSKPDRIPALRDKNGHRIPPLTKKLPIIDILVKTMLISGIYKKTSISVVFPPPRAKHIH